MPVELFQWGQSPDHFILEKPHAHEFDEILFFTEGGGIHEIDFHEHTIHTNSIHFVPRSCVHFINRGPHSKGFTLAFDNAYFEKNKVHSFYNPLFKSFGSEESFVINFDDTMFLHLLSLSDILRQQINKSKRCYKEKCFLLSMELLLNSLASENRKNKKGKQFKPCKNLITSQFISLVKNNVCKSTSVSWYAKELFITPTYLSNLIKLELQQSPKQYIITMLIHSVKKYLLESKQCFKKIANEHNMDLSKLGKLFKKHVGFTMSEYRSSRIFV